MTRIWLFSLAALATLGLGVLILPSFSPEAQGCHADKQASDLSQTEANAIYDCIKDNLAASYASANGVPDVSRYRTWTNVTTAPLVSATHGRRLVNHLVNDIALELYTQWEGMKGQRFPTDAAVAKESFRITQSGEVRPGPLFIMQKAAPGASPATDDWIYTRVFPDGTFQRTLGTASDKVLFCHDCHVKVLKDYDAMFFPTVPFRAKN
ncbi:MAG: hypothetical protein AAGC81_00770 [Pseudomonadota bacterium]